ncbi:MAG TPA: HigA family addiction module antitoxin [Acidisarcina sp.]
MLVTKRRPVNVDENLTLEFVEPLGITHTELADRAGLPRKHVNELCRGKLAVTADTALKLARIW